MDSVRPPCPHCGKPRTGDYECPYCGVIYAKAIAREVAAPNAPPNAVAPPPTTRTPARWDGDTEDARLEWRLRLFAIPAALAIAWVAVQSGFLHMLIRVFLSMWVHEAGHAVTAWLCGFSAIPTPWRTIIEESRSALMSLIITARLVWAIVRGVRSRRWFPVVSGAILLPLQAYGTLVLKPSDAQALITFGGDGCGLILATCLMATVYSREGGAIRKGLLRWGFLVIGAASFADILETWWAARTDFARIPFGELEGTGLTDASKLTETYGWLAGDLIHRYVYLGFACLGGLAVLYVVGLVQTRKLMKDTGA